MFVYSSARKRSDWNVNFFFDLRISTMKHVKFVRHRGGCWMTFMSLLNAPQVSHAPVPELRVSNHRTITASNNSREFDGIEVRIWKISNSQSRFDAPEYSDRYIDNEYHASKNILMPTRRTRDQIEILSKYKFREPAKRYSGKLVIIDIRRLSNQIKQHKLTSKFIKWKLIETMKNIWNHFSFTHKTHYTQKLPDKLLVIEGKHFKLEKMN